jgi:glycerophosphoryl diester phosphodiesterase
MQHHQSWISDAPLVIAHRGASLLAPENTIAAFKLAVELGADAIEFDVKLSCDGCPVVHHDMKLGRTTTGNGRVKDHSIGELKKFDAGVKFSKKFVGESIPTLKEVVSEFQKDILLNIELTNYNDPLDDLPGSVLKLVKEYADLEKILISSFNPLALREVRKTNSEVRTALLLAPNLPNIIHHWLQRLTPHQDLHPHRGMVTEDMIKRIHQSNGRVNAWTINDYQHMVELLEKGINGIITDDVETALRARRDVYSL